MINDLEPNIAAVAALGMGGVLHVAATETAATLATKLGSAPAVFYRLAAGGGRFPGDVDT